MKPAFSDSSNEELKEKESSLSGEKTSAQSRSGAKNGEKKMRFQI